MIFLLRLPIPNPWLFLPKVTSIAFSKEQGKEIVLKNTNRDLVESLIDLEGQKC